MPTRLRRTFRRAWPASLLLVTACAELPASAKQQKHDAEVAYRQGNYRTATEKLDGLLASHPDHPESAEAYYLRALCNANQSNKAQAAQDAQQCIRVSQQPELTVKARAMAGALLLECGSYAAAVEHLAASLAAEPEQPQADLIRYRYATALQRQGEWGRARQEFAVVYQRYPLSDLAQHAKRMCDWPHDFFTIQCGAFRDQKAAGELVRKLKSGGLGPWSEVRPRSGERLHMVFVGRYSQYETAEGALGDVQRRLKGAVIVP